MPKKIVRWERWADPFDDEKLKEAEESVDDDRAYKDSFEKAEQQGKRVRYTGPVLVGPMGIIPITENNTPSKIYNFWMMHTNFNISKPVLEKIRECPGVETLDVFTRYRARIGIGKVFKEDKVRKKISLILTKEEPKKEVSEPITPKLDNLNVLKKQMASRYKFWAIAILKNGEMKLFGGDSQEFVEHKIAEIEYDKTHKSWEK